MVRKRWIARLSEIAQNPAKTRASSDSLKGVVSRTLRFAENHVVSH
jgi:hypothetical protein